MNCVRVFEMGLIRNWHRSSESAYGAQWMGLVRIETEAFCEEWEREWRERELLFEIEHKMKALKKHKKVDTSKYTMKRNKYLKMLQRYMSVSLVKWFIS
jgi:hypothetical protein